MQSAQKYKTRNTQTQYDIRGYFPQVIFSVYRLIF